MLKLLSIITSDNQYHQSTIDTGIISRLVELLSINDNNLKQAVLEVMNNIAEKGTNEQKLQLLECHMLKLFHSLLNHSDEDLRLEARTFVSLITEGTSSQKKAVIDAGLVRMIIDNLVNGKADYGQWEKIVIYNLTVDASEEVIGYLTQCGIISHLCEILSSSITRNINVSTLHIYTSFSVYLNLQLFNIFSAY